MKRDMGKSPKIDDLARTQREILDIIFGEAVPQSPDDAAEAAVDRIWDAVEKRRIRDSKAKNVLDAQA